MGILSEQAKLKQKMCHFMPEYFCDKLDGCHSCPAQTLAGPLIGAGYRHQEDAAKDIFYEIEGYVDAYLDERISREEFLYHFLKARDRFIGRERK